MISFANQNRAFDHARGVARSGGLDLVEAVLDGWLRPAELAQIVDGCQFCAVGLPCKSSGPGALPASCANADLFGASAGQG
jgi:hypothetical protein